jgi:ribosomal protein S12 methylthiotransferase
MTQSPIKLGAVTLGCPKNTADTEAVLASLPERFQLCNVTDAEIVIVNTCAFLQKARDEVYEKLDFLKDKQVVLFGCMAGIVNQDIFASHPQVKAVVSGLHYPRMDEILDSVAKGQRVFAVAKEPLTYVEMDGKLLLTPPSYAYVKIAEGCDNGCSYCLIPKLKGHYRSRSFDSIVAETKDLIGLGVKEINLVAQDCGLYGFDLHIKRTLAELLKAIAEIPGDFWIRVLYVYPERINDDLLSVMAENPKICKYLDIPLQHGDPDILRAMHRPYDMDRIKERIAHVRHTVPGITLRTSLIAGFPGEADRQFTNLLDFIEKIHFDHVGVFEYSQEPGTKAFHLPRQLDDKTKKTRRAQAMEAQQRISFAINQKLIGKTLKALIETYDPQRKLYLARPARFAPEIDGTLFVKSKAPLVLNEFHDVKITGAEPYDLMGEAV